MYNVVIFYYSMAQAIADNSKTPAASNNVAESELYKKRQAALAVSVYSKIYEVQLVITNNT